MRIIVVIILLSFLATACNNENENKVIYLVRHAEKDVTPKNDPPLTTDGVIRSVDLASWFNDIKVDSIFSTDYARTRETAEPVAERQNLQISLYEPKNFATKLKALKVDTILVIGHSNTILEEIEALGFEKPQKEIKESEYDKIFELRFASGEVITHSYGSKYKE
ncbi:histidine phosphatase family protein [Marivirga harenae]|uniref:SixA phosphatase family protein n=1 Tax=Marivirga harenae TaxID=2010992 RepID=UPI0026E10262|nr:histidine phosphatase family protein [Marivirga harenae]WKV13786.1 histidine phosphatase family protein [Marivirga harenae]|tara:strand:+ start:87250 stop:87744 length:495 start_codon:yes stop_codon:yes gene_type:complete